MIQKIKLSLKFILFLAIIPLWPLVNPLSAFAWAGGQIEYQYTDHARTEISRFCVDVALPSGNFFQIRAYYANGSLAVKNNPDQHVGNSCIYNTDVTTEVPVSILITNEMNWVDAHDSNGGYYGVYQDADACNDSMSMAQCSDAVGRHNNWGHDGGEVPMLVTKFSSVPNVLTASVIDPKYPVAGVPALGSFTKTSSVLNLATSMQTSLDSVWFTTAIALALPLAFYVIESIIQLMRLDAGKPTKGITNLTAWIDRRRQGKIRRMWQEDAEN